MMSLGLKYAEEGDYCCCSGKSSVIIYSHSCYFKAVYSKLYYSVEPYSEKLEKPMPVGTNIVWFLTFFRKESQPYKFGTT